MSNTCRIGVGGPVGSGKTALIEAITPYFLKLGLQVLIITNDIVTTEDAKHVRKMLKGYLAEERIIGVETGACPHTAVREDPSMNIAAVEEMETKFPDSDVVLIESGGDNLTLTFSPALVDFFIYAIDAMVAELTEAVKGLVARGDVTDLKALIDQYTKENLKAEDHTTSTWSAYETALNAADAIVTDNSNSDQAAVDAAKKVLEDAHAALAKRGNTDALKALIEEYKELKEADYTHETWVKYEEALEAANGIVADNSNKTQAEVDAAKDALKAAKEALVKAPVDPQLDKSKLQAAVDAAKAKDENAYTTASYNAM